MTDVPGAPAGVPLEIRAVQLGPIGTNCYLVRPLGAKRGVVVDPGDQGTELLAYADAEGFEIEAVLVTHCHWDHIGAVATVVRETGAPVWMSSIEAPALETPEQFEFPGMPAIEPCAVTHRLDGGERIEVAGMHLDVLLLPGHSPGHLAFVGDAAVAPDDGTDLPPIAFVGDVIFRGSVGRTDLPYADGEELNRSLRSMVAALRPETVLLSGHGEPTDLEHELRTNPFLQGWDA